MSFLRYLVCGRSTATCASGMKLGRGSPRRPGPAPPASPPYRIRARRPQSLWVPITLSPPLTWRLLLDLEGQVGHRAARRPLVQAPSVLVPLRFAYLAVLRVFGWLALLVRSDRAKDGGPGCVSPAGARRSSLPTAADHLSADLARWHASLVRRRWTYLRRSPGRTRIAAVLRALVLETARDNPGSGYRRIHGELTGLSHKTAASALGRVAGRALPGDGRRADVLVGQARPDVFCPLGAGQ
jgi:hypothetical protein